MHHENGVVFVFTDLIRNFHLVNLVESSMATAGSMTSMET